MKEQEGPACRQAGQTAILIVFVLGMISVLIGLSLAQTGFTESLMGRSESGSAKAFYAANSGVEDALFKINDNPTYLNPGYNLPVGDGQAIVVVSGDDKNKTIESTGTNGVFVRKLRVEVQNSSLSPGFIHAVHTGQGGFELRNNTLITARGGAEGNVYSNGSVWGAKNDYNSDGTCKNSASKIDGSVWAVNEITRLEDTDSGVCINKDAHAANLNYCYINNTPYSPNNLSGDCPSAMDKIDEPIPTIIPLPNMGIPTLKNITQRKKTFSGDCLIDGTPGCYIVNNGVATIGDIYITGSLIKPNSTNLNIAGPVYVEGDINFGSNSTIGLDSSVSDGISQIIVAEGKITSASNISYLTRTSPSGQKMFLLFISDRGAPAGNLCSDPSILLSSNAESVLFYATQSCLLVNANSTFHGAILGEKIRVENNSTVEYDPDLASAIFGLTRSGGWLTLSFKEE